MVDHSTGRIIGTLNADWTPINLIRRIIVADNYGHDNVQIHDFSLDFTHLNEPNGEGFYRLNTEKFIVAQSDTFFIKI